LSWAEEIALANLKKISRGWTRTSFFTYTENKKWKFLVYIICKD
jgi:hypothetical protein